ncbi:MAG: type II toxin-antitoxin system HicB family antitoxin [Verrucomicrobium sp.]|nr:type II toxin-antitoxin system HicB family antitoxin [Verrucomicrobium sp.]
MTEFAVLIERDPEGVYLATVPALRGCHTQADSLESLRERVHEAIHLCLGMGKAAHDPAFIGIEKVEV